MLGLKNKVSMLWQIFFKSENVVRFQSCSNWL